MGVLIKDCPNVVADLKKVWFAYWYLSDNNRTLPFEWPPELNTQYNLTHPMNLNINDQPANLFISVSCDFDGYCFS